MFEMSKARLRCIHFLVIWEQTEFHDNLLQELIIFILSDNRQEFLPGKVRNPFFPLIATELCTECSCSFLPYILCLAGCAMRVSFQSNP